MIVEWLQRALMGAVVLGAVYTFLALTLLLIFLVVFPRWYSRRRLNSESWSKSRLISEFLLSLGSVLTGSLLLDFPYDYLAPWHSLVYHGVPLGGWWWIASSVAILIFLHDTNFYWAHRLLHRPFFFRRIHYAHHLSRNPSPLTASAFHPIETVLLTFWLIPTSYFLPLNDVVIRGVAIAIFLHSFFFHMGIDLLPLRVRSSRAGQWINSPTNHNRHHRDYSRYFGSFTFFWDWLMKTHDD